MYISSKYHVKHGADALDEFLKYHHELHDVVCSVIVGVHSAFLLF